MFPFKYMGEVRGESVVSSASSVTLMCYTLTGAGGWHMLIAVSLYVAYICDW